MNTNADLHPKGMPATVIMETFMNRTTANLGEYRDIGILAKLSCPAGSAYVPPAEYIGQAHRIWAQVEFWPSVDAAVKDRCFVRRGSWCHGV
ncbi:hypothetical protein [Paraburkholderia youngii]|uniref:hypothetical protein n=1 Tax=Paraburkholderia youngii TaxID=2782701 RepID=UPI001595CE3C|nr:hypothetical protein [Paraburkholderia youngii]